MTGQAKGLAASPGIVVSPGHTPAPPLVRIWHGITILAVPALAVVAILTLAWQWSEISFTHFDGVLSPPQVQILWPSLWLTWGHALVPAIFLVANLVNRRYGENFAIAHILTSWTLVMALAIAVMGKLITLGPLTAAPPLRIAAAFVGAMVLGQLAGVYVFDRTRGVAWWNAPAYSALTSSFIAVPVFYASAFIGSDWIWLNHMSIDLGLKAAMSFALLIPYFLLRPIIPPVEGLGGY